MWISDFAIDRPVVTIVLMLSLVVFGLISLFTLETDEFPEIDPPVVAISLPYPGASPATVEREVIVPFEDALAAISGVDRITSTALDSFGIVVVEFLFEKELLEATQDVRDRFSEIRQELPLELEEPVITRFDPNQLPIVSLTLSSDRLTPAELTRMADPGITGELQGISGVAQVNLVGGVHPELTVELRPEALAAAGVSVAQVVDALQAANLEAPVGRLTSARQERSIRLLGRPERARDFERLAVTAVDGRLVRLGELAVVSEGAEEQRSLALFNGLPAVAIDIVKNTDASTTTVSQAVRERVEALRADLPEGVRLDVVRDSGERVAASVADVQRTLFEGAVLTVGVVFVFLGSWRSTVITGLALPVSVLASFIAVWAFGFTLNTLSLLGLSLSIGILIDDAIVVRENIVRHMEMGKDHTTAAREGTAEIGLAVAATTFSIVVVFVPIGFMGGLAQQWMAPMALTIASSVLVSLLVSFSLDPMLSAYWPDPSIGGPRRGIVGRALDRFDAGLDHLAARYRRVIGWALDHRLVVFLIALLAFVSALGMPALGLLGSSFLPIQDQSEFTLALETPPGSSLAYTRAKAERASAIARDTEGVLYTYTTVGGQGEAVDEASIYVRLVPKNERPLHQDEIADRIRQRVSRLVGVTATLSTGFGGKQIQLQLRGPDPDRLDALAARILEEVRQVPGAVDVGLSTKGRAPQVEIAVDRPLASSMGLTVGQIAGALRPAFAGVDVGDWIDAEGETRDVRLRFIPSARERPESLAALPLRVLEPEPAMVPLGHVVTLTVGDGPAQIQHLDRQRVITIEANTRDRALSEVVGDIQQRLRSIDLPPGYTLGQGGDVENQQEVFGRILGALLVAVLLMYLILVVQFGSFLDPVGIMASLPLSLIGVVAALLWVGGTLNLMSMIGVLLLMGLVTKNAILLIDFAKWAEEAGQERHAAIIDAGAIRLRPILMTTAATIAAMVPVALGLGEGADFRAPLGQAVIGGMVTSTLLTLLVIPTLYDVLCGMRDAVGRRIRAWMRSSPPVPP